MTRLLWRIEDWLADLRIRRRMKRFARYRREAFGSPPMTPGEVQAHQRAVARQRERDEAGRV